MKIPHSLKIDHLSVYPLNPLDSTMGWEAFCFLDKTSIVAHGGGYAKTEELAKTIAISETIERHLFENLLNEASTIELKSWGLDVNKTTSGFAFGANPSASLNRAIAEAFEHYVRFHGIYQGFNLDTYHNYHNDLNLCPASIYISTFFDEIICYHYSAKVKVNNEILDLKCLIVFGIKDNGVFIGAKCAKTYDGLLRSSLVESLRNLRIFKSYLLKNKYKLIEDVEIRNFNAGINSDKILKQINSAPLASYSGWPQPIINILKIEKFDVSNGYLSRAIINYSPPWYNLSIEKLI